MAGLACFADEVLLHAGRRAEAYEKYALEANRATTYLARCGRGAGGKGAKPCVEAPAAPKPFAMSCAQRLKRVFAIAIDTCARCQGRLRVADSVKPPLPHSLLRRTGLTSGLSLPPPARNPSVGRPGRQSDALASRPPQFQHAPSLPDRFTSRAPSALPCELKAGGPATAAPARRAAARAGAERERSSPGARGSSR